MVSDSVGVTVNNILARSHFTQTHANGETDELTALLVTGQDPALAAVLFCDEHKFGHDASFIIRVAKSLQDNIEANNLIDKMNSHMNLTKWPKTAGAFKKRAAISSTEERYDDAAADYVRAYMRPGIDPQAAEIVLKLLAETMKDLIEYKEQVIKESLEEAARLARIEEENAAVEASLKLKAEDEADWSRWMEFENSFLASLSNGEPNAMDPPSNPDDGPMVSMSLTKSTQDGHDTSLQVWAVQRQGEDAAAAASRFCRAYGVPSATSMLDVARHLKAVEKASKHDDDGDVVIVEYEDSLKLKADQYVKESYHLESRGEFGEAATVYARAILTLEGIEKEEGRKPQMEEVLKKHLISAVELDRATKLFLAEDWDGCLEALHKFSLTPKATGVYLMRAKSFAQLGRWGDVTVAAGTWLSKVGSHSVGRWTRGSPRMLLASLGAGAALELGDVDKAKKYMQLVLRADPDQPEFGQQYAALKKLMKHIKTADDLLAKSYNHRALESLEFSLASMRGLMMTSGTFRSSILLRMCKAYSSIKRHEEALETCENALALRQGGGDPSALLEALETRSEVLANDNDFSEASRDLGQALNIAETSGAKPEKIHELRRKQQQTQHSEKLWNERRDHATVLELPANLDQLNLEKRCSWIKKQHHKLARKWHPDKYHGNRERGSRKMREVSEAKKILVERYKCNK